MPKSLVPNLPNQDTITPKFKVEKSPTNPQTHIELGPNTLLADSSTAFPQWDKSSGDRIPREAAEHYLRRRVHGAGPRALHTDTAPRGTMEKPRLIAERMARSGSHNTRNVTYSRAVLLLLIAAARRENARKLVRAIIPELARLIDLFTVLFF